MYPSIHFLHLLNPIQGPRGLEPIPAVIGQEEGYTLDRSPVHQRATPNILTLNHKTTDISIDKKSTSDQQHAIKPNDSRPPKYLGGLG